MQRVFMIGWDGATFDLIRPWVQAGKLPNIARLMEEGVHGPLRSTLPPWTFPAWTSFMTGKNPGKHAIYDFFQPRPKSYNLEFVHGGHRRAPTFWRLLSDAGRKVVSISIPCTFPPEKVNGIQISGFDFPGEGPGSHVDPRGMYPTELYEELNRTVGPHPIDASIVKEINRGELEVALARILDTLRQKARTAQYLLEHKPWDCFMILFGETDGSGHQFWKYCDRNSPLFTEHPTMQDSILRVYQEADRILGDLRTRLPEDVTLLMMSDHGFGGVGDWAIYPNCWLQDKGFLHMHAAKGGRSSRVLETLKLWAVGAFPAWLQRFLYRFAAPLVGRIEARVRYGSIDWSRTEAYFDENPYFPVLRINLQGRQPGGVVTPGQHYEAVRTALIRELESWRHPETGKPIVERAYRREEVYTGPYVEKAADIIPKWALHKNYSYSFRKSSGAGGGRWLEHVDPQQTEQVQFYTGKSGTHRDDGIFLAHGPALQSGQIIPGARIIDLAPTILRLLDVPVPPDMDGRVLDEIFRAEAWASQGAQPEAIALGASVSADSGYSPEDEEKMNERLRSLGYVE